MATALSLHCKQQRKGSGVPYLSHLLSVSALVLEYGGDEDTAIAALLHDAVEDQGGPPTLELIRARFGARSAAIVAECTEEQWEERQRKWRQRKEDFIAALAGVSAEARLVIAADKLHNTYSYLRDHRQIGDELWSRFKDGHRGVSWFLRSVTDALRSAGPHPILDELEAAVARLERLS